MGILAEDDTELLDGIVDGLAGIDEQIQRLPIDRRGLIDRHDDQINDQVLLIGYRHTHALTPSGQALGPADRFAERFHR